GRGPSLRGLQLGPMPLFSRVQRWGSLLHRRSPPATSGRFLGHNTGRSEPNLRTLKPAGLRVRACSITTGSRAVVVATKGHGHFVTLSVVFAPDGRLPLLFLPWS